MSCFNLKSDLIPDVSNGLPDVSMELNDPRFTIPDNSKVTGNTHYFTTIEMDITGNNESTVSDISNVSNVSNVTDIVPYKSKSKYDPDMFKLPESDSDIKLLYLQTINMLQSN